MTDSQPPAPFQGACLAGESKHLPHLSLSVFFEFVFPLTYFPFSLSFKNSFLSECRDPSSPNTTAHMECIYRAEEGILEQSGYMILNWLGHGVDGISELAFVCVRHETFVK